TDLAGRGCRLSSDGIDGASRLLPEDEAGGTAALSLQACTELPDALVGQLDQRHLYMNLPGAPVYQANGLLGNSQVIRGSEHDYLPVLDVGNHNRPATILLDCEVSRCLLILPDLLSAGIGCRVVEAHAFLSLCAAGTAESALRIRTTDHV